MSSVVLGLSPTKGTVMLSSDEQPEKAAKPILVTDAGMVIDVSAVQFLNAELPMLVTSSPL